jgi:hypothetical protein
MQADAVSKGVERTILWQVLVIVVTFPFIMFWGLTQWLALIPQYLWFEKKGYPLAAKGVLIMGSLGVLLNGGCAFLFMNVRP